MPTDATGRPGNIPADPVAATAPGGTAEAGNLPRSAAAADGTLSATTGATADARAPEPIGAGLPTLRDTVARHGLDARKSLGQHFLLDQNICARVAGQAGDLSGRHVVEVGPGPGGLTRALVDSAAAHVTAIELDRRAIAALAELQDGRPGRLTVIEADALKVDAAALTEAPRCVVANLPYNVGTALLVHWLEEAERWESLTLMFQQEVAARIVAAPDTEGYGRLSVLAQWRCEARMVLTLPPGAFSPPPKVWSAVVHLRPRAQQPEPALAAAMGRLTAAAFGQRRKMLRGSLKSLGQAEALLDGAGIEPTRRAETLTVAEFEVLARALLARGAG